MIRFISAHIKVMLVDFQNKVFVVRDEALGFVLPSAKPIGKSGPVHTVMFPTISPQHI